MNLIKTGFEDLFIIEPDIFADHRGYFFESYNKSEFEKLGLNYDFVQDNQSKSSYGTIRGLHMQRQPYTQAKLVRVLEGAVRDVAVDLRKGSPTFGRHFAVELSADNSRMLMIPRGFAHGFSVLTAEAVFFYKCDNVYNRDSEITVNYADPILSIDWRVSANEAALSDKDRKAPLLKDSDLL